MYSYVIKHAFMVEFYNQFFSVAAFTRVISGSFTCTHTHTFAEDHAHIQRKDHRQVLTPDTERNYGELFQIFKLFIIKDI